MGDRFHHAQGPASSQILSQSQYSTQISCDGGLYEHIKPIEYRLLAKVSFWRYWETHQMKDFLTQEAVPLDYWIGACIELHGGQSSCRSSAKR